MCCVMTTLPSMDAMLTFYTVIVEMPWTKKTMREMFKH